MRLSAGMTEAEWQALVIDIARAHGWLVAHFRPALTSSGHWSTPVAADGAGFPDLVLVRGECLIFAELKTERGRVSAEQRAWLAAIAHAGVPAFVWRPSDEPAVWRVLTGREPPGAGGRR